MILKVLFLIGVGLIFIGYLCITRSVAYSKRSTSYKLRHGVYLAGLTCLVSGMAFNLAGILTAIYLYW